MPTDSWRQMAERYGKEPEDIKEALPIEWVVAVAADVRLTENGEGRSIGLCPFHADNNPSLDVYANGERWGCYPCDRGGDVFDFIGDYWELTEFGAKLEKSLELLQTFESEGDGWEGVIDRAEPVTPATVAELGAEIQESLRVMEKETTEPVVELLKRKGLSEIDMYWIRKEWRLGVRGDEVLAGYWDQEGHPVAYKTRHGNRGGWIARKGVKLTELYGVWQLMGPAAEADVWLCEGETDTWLASWLLRGRGIALGLPSGAGSHIKDHWVELMRGRRVTLVMDADRAGRMAAQRWHTQIVGVAREVLITFPEGDLCDSRDPLGVLEAGEVVTKQAGFIMADPDGRAYRQLGAQGPGEVLSNFVFEPTKHITYLDTHGVRAFDGYEGSFSDETQHVIRISTPHFRTAQSMREWSNKEGRAWYGASAKHVQSFLDGLQAQAPFLKKETAVPVAGLWGEDTANPVFVMPEESGGVIGSAQGAEKWSYSDQLSKVEIGARFRIMDRKVDEAWARNALGALLKLNAIDVMTPLVGWMTSSILRKLVREFPPMAVLGDSGSGKTAMTHLVMQFFFGYQGSENNITSTTPYSVTAESAGSNGMVIWWDEYRRGGRRDTFRMIGQVIRDSWTASVSRRGGMGEDLSKVEQTAAAAPLLLSGEAAMEERSHIDRVVVIRLSKDGPGDLRNFDAFEDLMDVVSEGGGGVLGRRLIEWQLANLDRLRASAPSERDRQAQGVAVLRWGWEMFVEFCMDEWGIDLKWELDVSRVTAQREDVPDNPEVEALLEALDIGAHDDRDDPVPVAWAEHDGADGNPSVVVFRPRAFYNWAEKAGYAFPGGARATKQLLMDRYGWLTKDRVKWKPLGGIGKEHNPSAVRLIGVLEAEAAVIRKGEVEGLERSMKETGPVDRGRTEFDA